MIIMDWFSAHFVVLLFIATFETISVAWVYGETRVDGFNEGLRVPSVKSSLVMTHIPTHPPGADRFYRNIEDMLGYQVFPVLKYCWLFITPFVCMVRFFFISTQPLVPPMTFPPSSSCSLDVYLIPYVSLKDER